MRRVYDRLPTECCEERITMMSENTCLTIDGKELPISGERNLLEMVRKAKIELPTFCYHSELSVYGACRLCMVEVEGRGLVPACTTPPEAGLKVRTTTEEVRKMRKIIVELLLANHDQSCPTCPKSNRCQLQNLARRLEIKDIRFKNRTQFAPIDDSSPSLVRDPGKCVLCGDCVRVCSEIQSVGAIDFAYRGSQSVVLPSFGKNLDSVECVYCGQCARVCPTGALTPKSEIDQVWKALENPAHIVVAQIAPAVRIALGEIFGLEPGVTSTGQMITALKMMGFEKVFDTSFTADLTVIEESHEFLKRTAENKKLPLFTSCCPAWVKFAEQYYPEYLPNLSSCRSPQQMFGSLTKEVLSKTLGVCKDNIKVVSIMPCTAKKFEAKRPEFKRDGLWDVDYVLTTQEVARMIAGSGLQFKELEPQSFDLPFGFKTGAGIIFGNSGGVSEAVLRFVSEKLKLDTKENYEFTAVRGEEGIRELAIDAHGKTIRMAIVSGLGNARKLIQQMKAGEKTYDFVEVMACPGGCIGGAGQPNYSDLTVRKKRTQGLYENDRMLELHKAQQNPYVTELYEKHLEMPGSKAAHSLLHTRYQNRRRTRAPKVELMGSESPSLEVGVCFGTSCFLKGSQKILGELLDHVYDEGLEKQISVKASFCFEGCTHSPNIKVGEEIIKECTLEKVKEAIKTKLAVIHKGEK